MERSDENLGRAGALTAGLVGSTHCVAMCGGIAGALGLSSRSAAVARGVDWRFPLAYNGGRVLSYTLAGALAASIGAGVTSLAGLAQARTVAQLLAGVVLIAIGIKLARNGRGLQLLDRPGRWLWSQISPLTRKLLPIRSLPRALLAGMLWGWLPCAMAYSVLLVAALGADVVQGALVMAAFGIGTAPALLLSGSALARVGNLGARRSTRLAAGLLIAAFGLVTLGNVALWPHAAHHLLDGLAACVGIR